MGMKSVRMSRKYHAMPMMDVKQVDISGLRGTKTRDDAANVDAGSNLTPTKYRPFETSKGSYPDTKPPKSAEHDGKGEHKSMKKKSPSK